jgi:predicted metal-dependent enzyme (double-stranded beta helix superfamily)
MTATEQLVDECLAAAADDVSMLAVKEVVERAVRDATLQAELVDGPELTVLHCSPQLTVASVILQSGTPQTLPHDHRMWALVGLFDGKEENEFFRDDHGRLTPSGGKVIEKGDVLAMGAETIHAIRNPLAHTTMRALHVYGGDLVHVDRNMWCNGPDWTREPYDPMRVIGAPLESP